MCFAIIIGSKQKLISSGKTIEPSSFSNENGGEIINKRNYNKLNTYLENKKNELNDIILDYQYKNEAFTFEKIINKFNDESGNCFIKFATKELEELKPKIADKTYKDYKVSLNNLKDYCRHLPFHDLTYQFLTKYEIWLKTIKKRNQNSRFHNFAFIRKFLNLAINYGLTNNYPFRQFKFSQNKVEREYLTEEEVDKLQDLFDSNKLTEKLQNTLANFLFTCYTGIAADDMKNKERLRFNGETVSYNRGKTGEYIKVPLTSKAKLLVPEIQTRSLKQKHHRVTTDLKEIMGLAKIDKHITYHCGRHTFAIISFMKGIGLSVISKVLGHTTTKTTEIYAKVVDELMSKEMAMWDD